MGEFVLKEFIKFVNDWQDKNFPPEKSHGSLMLLGCTEELGELCHAHLKGIQGIRHSPEKILELKKDSVGDLIVYLINYCKAEKIDLIECLEIVKKELEKRNWKIKKTFGNPPITTPIQGAS